ncbi:MAG: TetR/AcrR family transcriptional regulator [Bacteroidales bacterium]|nr:TetR/AcrR family transcriptional regulator [Bacteroidales bacterium]
MTKEEEILKAAEEEFFSNGYDATSTANIAQRAGVTHAMVNYYFRTKEKLFIRILDDHVYELLHSLKPVMQADGNVIRVATDAAGIIFDKLNQDRRFPFLLSDISRNHPDFLLRYKETFDTVCKDSLEMHRLRLEKCIRNAQARECTMNDIYNTVLTLATSPFLNIPVLCNVCGMDDSAIDEYLNARRREMILILQARYSVNDK